MHLDPQSRQLSRKSKIYIIQLFVTLNSLETFTIKETQNKKLQREDFKDKEIISSAFHESAKKCVKDVPIKITLIFSVKNYFGECSNVDIF